MRKFVVLGTAVIFVATAADSRVSVKSRVNQDCKNEFKLGMDTSGGTESTYDFVTGLLACSDNETRRWSLDGSATTVKSGKTQRAHSVEGDYIRRFGDGWLAIAKVSHEASTAEGLQQRTIVSPGIGLERTPAWGTVRLGAGFGHTWENTRKAPPTSFPQLWSQLNVRWRIRPDISFRQRLTGDFDTKNDKNYWYTSDSTLQFQIGEHFSIETGGTLRWDNVPAPDAKKTSWTTSTLFGVVWGQSR